MQNFDDLAKQGFASDAKRKEKLLDLATKRVNYAKAKSLHDLTVAGSTTEEKRVAELAVADAKKSLNIESFNRDADLAVCKAAVQLATVDLKNYERDLGRKKQDLEWATVRAPVRGHVVFNEVFKGSMTNKAPVLVGEQRAAGSELCMICDTSSLKLRVHVNESNIKDIAMGQRARVTLPALPGRNFEAIVSEVAVVAQDKNAALSNLALRRSGEAFVNVVQVKLNFINVPEEDRRQIRVGFTADVYIQTGDKTLALSVPWKAVQYDSAGAPYCEVQTDSGVQRRTLKIGRANASHAEVLEGLADRDIVRNLNGSSPAGEAKNVSDNPKSSLPGGS
jgi:multidrug resistance efflux pump